MEAPCENIALVEHFEVLGDDVHQQIPKDYLEYQYI